MFGPRTRRVMKWLLLGVAAPLLLLTSYICSYLSVAWLAGKSYVGVDTHTRLEQTVFLPLDTYALSDLPGSDLLFASYLWLCSDQAIPFAEIYSSIVDESEPGGGE